MDSTTKAYLKFGISLLLAFYCLYFLSSMDSWHFIDGVDLMIHEAGHVVFSPFGRFITIAGGSLAQLIMPSLFIYYFYRRNELYSAGILFYWLAVNFFNVAKYASDAIVMQLPLLGGDTSGHDWHNILSMLGILNYTSTVAGAIYAFGILTIIAGVTLTVPSLDTSSTPEN